MTRTRGLLATLTMLTLIVAPLPLASTAQAAPEGARVDVVIDAINPLLPGTGDQLRISGRAVNLTGQVIDDVRVRLRVASAPLDDRSDVGAAIDTALEPVGSEPAGIYYDSVSMRIDDALEPGEQTGFTLAVPFERLRLRAPGAYPIAIEALGRQEGVDEFDERLGIQRTFVPWFPAGADFDPVRVAWLWPLADWPARTASGALLDDRTPIALSDGGRLDDLVRIATMHPGLVTWIADPSLLQTASDIGDGYQVIRDGEPTIGDLGAAGPAWLRQLGNAVRDARTPLHLLPYADIDASASRRAGLATDVVRAITLSRRTADGTVNAPLAADLAWMPAGRIDRQTANLFASAGLTTVVLADDALAPTEGEQTSPPVATFGTAAGSVTAVLYDTAIAALLDEPQQRQADVVAVRQQVLAHLAVLSTTADDPTIVIAPPSVRWSVSERLANALLRATARASWIDSASLEQLLSPSLGNRRRASYGDSARVAELPATYLANVSEAQNKVLRFASVLENPAPITEPFGQALLRAQSSAWRSEQTTATNLLHDIRTELSERMSAVHVLSTGTVTFSGDTGAVPITIANDLDQAVTVGVQLVGDPTTRLQSEPLADIVIEPGRRASVTLDARVIGGEPLQARVQLLTPEGDPYGTASTIDLQSTAYARAASGVVLLAFGAIAIFVVVGIIRRIRKTRSAPHAPSPANDESMTT